MTGTGLIIAAPSSGSGKTVFTLGLLRALADRGIDAAAAKVGPDYIDPAFLMAASRGPCPNLDSWAMRPATLAARVTQSSAHTLTICEGVMGLFDGAPALAGESSGSTAEIAALTGWPVILLIDAMRQSGSAAATLRGFASHHPDVHVVGAVFNRVSGPNHRALIEEACTAAMPAIPLLGWLPRDPALMLPERHLGLVQARETHDIESRIAYAAKIVGDHIDIDALIRLAQPARIEPAPSIAPIPPLGQRIAIARDDAFAFAYPETLMGWRDAGAALSFFSPLADEAPAMDSDAVYLPGGYPELHAGVLANNARFLDGLRASAERSAAILGECGGAMTLGATLEDADGETHTMANLLPLATSFKTRRLHLGYRRCTLAADSPLGPAGARFRAHEFHYATETQTGGPSLFAVADARGRDLGPMGQVQGRVMGSFMHLIDAA
ncbi:MAG TPA: cobyrinate a,c-diamide synthase [Magnetospirillaceae bacterium]|jgi:cobyrinic acid a,c-diamide synthase